MNARILSVNGGSSSIKFSLFEKKEPLTTLFSGTIKNIGSSDTAFTVRNGQGIITYQKNIHASGVRGAVSHIMDWLGQSTNENITAIGHRVVFGMKHAQAEKIADQLLHDMQQSIAIDPDHAPGEIELIKTFQEKYPDIPQVACFDTAFHASMPTRATLLPLPRKYFETGLRRYGFHGISYSYLMEKLGEEKNIDSNGKIILAHLGSGASMAAVKNGKSIDSSMGFSPGGGFTMSTRSGDLDPGIFSYLMKNDSLDVDRLNDLVNRKSGLLGISETSADMEELLKTEQTDPRAADAVDIFCYQVKKWIGSFAAALGGLDTLVFSGGIGENAPPVRSRICEGLEFLGIELNKTLNDHSQKIISTDLSKVIVYVIPTNEEYMIAKSVCELLSIK